VAERKPFLLRIDGAVLDGLRAWAAADLRSLNAQIEYVLREAVRRRNGRRAEGPPAGTRPPPGAGGANRGQGPDPPDPL